MIMSVNLLMEGKVNVNKIEFNVLNNYRFFWTDFIFKWKNIRKLGRVE